MLLCNHEAKCHINTTTSLTMLLSDDRCIFTKLFSSLKTVLMTGLTGFKFQSEFRSGFSYISTSGCLCHLLDPSVAFEKHYMNCWSSWCWGLGINWSVPTRNWFLFLRTWIWQGTWISVPLLGSYQEHQSVRIKTCCVTVTLCHLWRSVSTKENAGCSLTKLPWKWRNQKSLSISDSM